MTFPGAGRAVWIGGSSGETTGRSADWSTYDATNDTAWQQWTDDTSTALGSTYQVTNTERNSVSLNRETSYLAITNGTQEFIGKVTYDALDATSAQIELTGAYDMERAELVNLGNKMMMFSLENKGSMVMLEHTPSGITSSGVLTDVYTSGAPSSERGFSLLADIKIPDTNYDDSPNYELDASKGTVMLTGGRLVAEKSYSAGGIGYVTNVPTFRAHQTQDWSRDLANPPSDSNINTIRNDMLTKDTSVANSLTHLSEMMSGSGGGWWAVNPANQSAYTDRPQHAYMPTVAYQFSADWSRNTVVGDNPASTDRTFWNYDGTEYGGDARQVVRPFFVYATDDYKASLVSQFPGTYDYLKMGINGRENPRFLDFRAMRSGSSLVVGWTTQQYEVSGQQGVRNESQIVYNTTNTMWNVGVEYGNYTDQQGALDDSTDGNYPGGYVDHKVANNDRVAYRSGTGRSEAELGEDLVQALRKDKNFIGMYGDTTGTKGGNLYLTACSLHSEDLWQIYNKATLNFFNADDVTATETHASNSIAVSVTNGADSTSTAFDPDTACLVDLHGDNFAVVWRKSTTAYISTFKVTYSGTSAPTITRLSDALSLGTVPSGNISGVKLGGGVAMITCGNYYRIIKTDTI